VGRRVAAGREKAVVAALELSHAGRTTAGSLLLGILAVEYGGWFLLRVVRNRHPATSFQRTFARAGHAHAGVLVTLALVAQLLADAVVADGLLATMARNGIAWAAILMPAGFFLASAGRGRTEPNRSIVLLYAGIVVLGAGAASLGLLLLTGSPPA
jgi:uncharacterized membrane protein YphA (DoxX/SURF4 family)